MKKYIYLFATAMAIAFAGCSDDELIEGGGIPVETGDEIMFGSSLNGDQNVVGMKGIETRTVYGDRTESGIPVYWDGTDTVAIYCPESSAPANHLVNYKIIPNTDLPQNSAQVIKVNTDEAGLQWGEKDDHRFFGIYPSSIVKAADEDDQKGKITASLPTLQAPIGWREKYDPVSRRKIFFGEPNMDYACMFAYTKVKKSDMAKDKTINLKFQNLITVLDISIPGPSSGTLTVTNVNVDVIEGTKKAICGDFNIYVNEADQNGHADCEPSGDPNKVYDRISIPCYDPKTGKFITLTPDDVINVKAFIIPDNVNSQIVRKFRITVSTLNGSAKRVTIDNVKPGTGTDGTNPDRVIVPHKINRILMPPIEGGEPANWMNNLDPNIYLTELSIPGSKFSYLTTENGASPAYQTATIEQQFATGIRAFIAQTGAKATYNVTRTGSLIGGYEYDYTLSQASSLSIYGAAKGTTLENTLDVITAGLKERPTECAFLILTCQSSEVTKEYVEDGWWNAPDNVGWDRAWIESVKYNLENLKNNNKYPIYKDEITANTTLGEVKGKIIIKVNTNTENQEKYMTKDDSSPALFAIWENPASHKPDYVSTVPLRWGTINRNSTRTPMNWMSAEVTNVGVEIDKTGKETSIKNMFKAAEKDYNDPTNQHDTFYMVDLGGVYTSDNSTMRLAKDMNPFAVHALQTRTENASTGLVFMNFADRGIKQSDGSYKGSGIECQSDYIIATIIDNNFKFALRKKPGGNGSN